MTSARETTDVLCSCSACRPSTSTTIRVFYIVERKGMSFPDYYAILNVSASATTEQIRQAYKKESLRSVLP